MVGSGEFGYFVCFCKTDISAVEGHIIQGHWFWFQLKARMWLPISPQPQ